MSEQTIDKQLEFVEWLKGNGMYNQWASAVHMQSMYEVWDKFQTPKHETEEKYLPCCATCTKWADDIQIGMHCTDIHKQVLRDDWCFDYISIVLPKRIIKSKGVN